MRNKFKFYKLSNIENFNYKALLIIWIQYILFDRFTELSNLNVSLIHKRGAVRLIPIDIIFNDFISTSFLYILKLLVLVLLIFNLINNNKNSLYVLITLVYFYELIKKGFGGHLDHRILTLYIFTIIVTMSLNNDFSNSKQAFSFAYLFFFLQYFFIGTARLFSGFPEIFLDDTFKNWILQRSLRPNFFNLQFGLKISEYINLEYLNIIFFSSTLIEVLAIGCIFYSKKYVKYICTLLILFHIGIYLFMAVNFIENIFLLIIFIRSINKDLLDEKIYYFR